MSNDINKMDVKQLRNEVQLLRDELAIFKRKYEDIIYNLDDDNFSSRIVKEKGDMKTAIEVNAKGIKTKVSQEELDNYSTIEQTAKSIQSVVSKGAKLDEAEEIASLEKLEANGDKEKIYVIREKTTNADGKQVVKSETYYYFNDITKQWEVLSGDSIYTMFEQTPEGFNLKGNVKIDGSTVITENLTLSGKVTWDMTNSPVLAQYSSDCVNWHSPMVDGDMYMQMSFDGGNEWSIPTKVVGTDGKNGTNGSSASVTFNAVNSALCSLFKKTTSGTPTEITHYYLYSPEIRSGTFLGCVFYAGSGSSGFSQMDEGGFTIYDDAGAAKVGIGYYSLDYNYPYISLGVGAGYSGNGVGSICKLGNGIWIGDSSVMLYGGDVPGGGTIATTITSYCPQATGIFIDFANDVIYKYIKGVPTAL